MLSLCIDNNNMFVISRCVFVLYKNNVFCFTNTHKFVLVQRHELYNLDFLNDFEFSYFLKEKNWKTIQNKKDFLKDSFYSCK